MKEEQACILDFEVVACVSLGYCASMYLPGSQAGALEVTASWIWVHSP